MSWACHVVLAIVYYILKIPEWLGIDSTHILD